MTTRQPCKRLLPLRRPARRAVMLVLTLWIVLILSLLAQSLAFEMTVEMKLTNAHRNAFLAEQAARHGIAHAITDIRNNALLSYEEGMKWSSPRFDCYGSVWAAGTTEPRDFEIKPGESRDAVASYDLLVVDEESKITLSPAPGQPIPAGLKNVMKYLLMLLEVEETAARHLGEAIQDWEDFDNAPASEQAGAATEEQYYGEILKEAREMSKDEDAPIVTPRNSPFDFVEELLQLPGMTPELFYGYDPEETKQPPFFPNRFGKRSGKNRSALRDLVTARPCPLNVNTAPYECLAAIFAEATGSLDSGRSIAAKIVEKRQGGREDGIEVKNAFHDLSDLAKIEGITPQLIDRARQVIPLTTKSDFFTIYCQARYGKENSRVLNSRTRNSQAKPQPVARIIAECRRTDIMYRGPFLQNWMPPGIRTEQVKRPEDDLIITAWRIPVVYITRWSSY